MNDMKAIEAARDAAIKLTAWLDGPDWWPKRHHIEAARNDLSQAADEIRRLTAALAHQSGEGRAWQALVNAAKECVRAYPVAAGTIRSASSVDAAEEDLGYGSLKALRLALDALPPPQAPQAGWREAVEFAAVELLHAANILDDGRTAAAQDACDRANAAHEKLCAMLAADPPLVAEPKG